MCCWSGELGLGREVKNKKEKKSVAGGKGKGRPEERRKEERPFCRDSCAVPVLCAPIFFFELGNVFFWLFFGGRNGR